MSKTVVGIFDNPSFAQDAASQIKSAGFRAEDISILSKQSNNDQGVNFSNQSDVSMQGDNIHDNISDGVVTGTVLGGLAGLLIGIGTVMVPGLGVIAAAGPIVGLLSGAVTGGVVGGLVDLGVPEDDSKTYENDIRSGKTLLTIKTDDNRVEQISTIFRNCKATKVETY